MESQILTWITFVPLVGMALILARMGVMLVLGQRPFTGEGT